MAARPRAPRSAENFSRNLEEIRRFLEPAGPTPFDKLLDRLFDDVVPALARFPRSGRDFLKHRVGSQEAAVLSRKLRARLKRGDDLREFVFDEYLLLYLVRSSEIVLLAIKHHRQLSFDLRLFW